MRRFIVSTGQTGVFRNIGRANSEVTVVLTGESGVPRDTVCGNGLFEGHMISAEVSRVSVVIDIPTVDGVMGKTFLT